MRHFNMRNSGKPELRCHPRLCRTKKGVPRSARAGGARSRRHLGGAVTFPAMAAVTGAGLALLWAFLPETKPAEYED